METSVQKNPKPQKSNKLYRISDCNLRSQSKILVLVQFVPRAKNEAVCSNFFENCMLQAYHSHRSWQAG